MSQALKVPVSVLLAPFIYGITFSNEYVKKTKQNKTNKTKTKNKQTNKHTKKQTNT